MFLRSVFVLSAAVFAAAQDSSMGLSSQCTTALMNVVGSPQASCLNPSGIISIALTQSNTSIVPAVDSWLTGLCALGPCSNSSLSAIVANITNGCASELESVGLTSSTNASLPTFVESYYPTLRDVLCLEDTTVSELCPVEELYEFQNYTGFTLTPANLLSVVDQMNTYSIEVPKNITCGDCSKASFSTIAAKFPEIVAANKSAIQSYCGSSFTDGSIPSSIKETASNSSSSGGGGSSSGAASTSVNTFTLGAAALAVVSYTFVLVA